VDFLLMLIKLFR